MNVDDYLKELSEAKMKKPRSKLTGFRDEIMRLNKERCSSQQIVDFLAKNNVKSSVGGVAWFIKTENRISFQSKQAGIPEENK